MRLIEMRDFLPAGTYPSHARDVRTTLYCIARKRNGAWIPASLDLTHLEETNIVNADGHLVNDKGDAGRKGFLPLGEYLESSDSHRVILSALCQKHNESWQWSTIDITNFNSDTTLSLVDGVLTVDPHSTN
jgi:hypothetical protein